MSKKDINSLKIKNMVLIALMTAIICVIAPFAIITPISPVPISLATFAIYLTIIILGWKDGVISVVLYVFLGFAGAPVFTGFTGGAAKILGPTGGYIIGYIFLAFIEGAFVDGACKTRPYEEGSASVRPYESVGASYTSAPILLGMVIGTVVLYIFGTIWLMRQAGLTLVAAFSSGVLPFIVGDIVKMFVALFVGTKIRKVLIKSGLA
jgi:biotin transport system substrate-specific component